MFLLHVCKMILLYFTQYFRPTLKKTSKPLIVWIEKRDLISPKINCVFAKCFETLAVLWNIDCLLSLQSYANKMGVLEWPGRKLGNLGKLGILFQLFLFQLFDFDLIPKIENSEEENSEKKFRDFQAFRGFWVFDMPLFRIFNRVS